MITWPHLAVEHNEIGLRNRSFELNLFSWLFRSHSFEALDERPFSISDLRIVFDIDIAGIFLDCFARLALIKHQVVERLRVPLVLL